jgi:hypothetical protein
MRRLLIPVFAASIAAAALGTTASGGSLAASGDTCTATGNGTSYTLNISIPSGSPQQYGFAFGAGGVSVTNVNIGGTQGTFSSVNLPSGSTGAWTTLTPILPGSAVASLTTSSAVNGSFSVMPAASAQSSDQSALPSYLDAVSCAISGSGLVPSNVFSVKKTVDYVAKSHVWHLAVTIPGPGTVSAVETRPTVGTGYAPSITVGSLVQAKNHGLKSGGTVTLVLRTTSPGLATLARTGSLKVRLDITFNPKDGKSASKILTLTLRK